MFPGLSSFKAIFRLSILSSSIFPIYEFFDLLEVAMTLEESLLGEFGVVIDLPPFIKI
jgi:hypothetical protein